MGTTRRRSRERREVADSLPDLWNRGESPPAWAHGVGEHHDELVELAFFGTDDRPRATTHPHYQKWFAAMRESQP